MWSRVLREYNLNEPITLITEVIVMSSMSKDTDWCPLFDCCSAGTQHPTRPRNPVLFVDNLYLSCVCNLLCALLAFDQQIISDNHRLRCRCRSQHMGPGNGCDFYLKHRLTRYVGSKYLQFHLIFQIFIT